MSDIGRHTADWLFCSLVLDGSGYRRRQAMTVFYSTSLMKLAVGERNVATNLYKLQVVLNNVILVYKLPTE